MADGALAGLVAGLHVGDARHEPVPQPPASLDAQDVVLSDEDMIEGIFFSIGGRVPRPNMNDVIAVNNGILSALLGCSAVCRVWRIAAARPILAAALDKVLSKYKLVMDFFRTKRDRLFVNVIKPAPNTPALAASEKELVSWLVSGYENGCGSVVADDIGLDSTGPCAHLILHLWQNGIHGPFVIVAPEPSWPSWQKAVLQLVDMRVALVRTADELEDHLIEPRSSSTPNLLLLPMYPAAADDLKVLVEVFEQLNSTFKLMIFDETQFRPPGLSLRHVNAFADSVNGDVSKENVIRLTNEHLPGDASGIMQTVSDACNGFGGHELLANVEHQMDRFCRGKRAQLLRQWAMGHVVLPIMQTQLSGALVMRRVNRGGRPHIVEREVPEHMLVDVHKDHHWMVNSEVRLEGLKSKPQYNGRVGHVHSYDERAERLHVLLDASEAEPARWIKVKDENVVTIADPAIDDGRLQPVLFQVGPCRRR